MYMWVWAGVSGVSMGVCEWAGVSEVSVGACECGQCAYGRPSEQV